MVEKKGLRVSSNTIDEDSVDLITKFAKKKKKKIIKSSSNKLNSNDKFKKNKSSGKSSKKLRKKNKSNEQSKRNGVRGSYDKITKKIMLVKELKLNVTTGQKISDWLTQWAGSWTFIIGFAIFLIIWMGVNSYKLLTTWDPFPYILLNLVLSCVAALQAPIILMSQNRTVERDRHKAELDYMVNRKAERENVQMMEDLQKIKKKLGVK